MHVYFIIMISICIINRIIIYMNIGIVIISIVNSMISIFIISTLISIVISSYYYYIFY